MEVSSLAILASQRGKLISSGYTSLSSISSVSLSHLAQASMYTLMVVRTAPSFHFYFFGKIGKKNSRRSQHRRSPRLAEFGFTFIFRSITTEAHYSTMDIRESVSNQTGISLLLAEYLVSTKAKDANLVFSPVSIQLLSFLKVQIHRRAQLGLVSAHQSCLSKWWAPVVLHQ